MALSPDPMPSGPTLGELVESLLGAVLFASAFLFGRRVAGARGLVNDARLLVSLGAGMSAAYVFVHVLPGLADLRMASIESATVPMPFHGRALYLLALLGFLVFYTLDNVSSRLSRSGADLPSRVALWLNVVGFAAYAWLLSYLLLHHFQEGASSMLLFAIAIALHLFGVDHGLHARHGAGYERFGRRVIAAACLAGWVSGALFTLPQDVLAFVVAFIAGAVIMNSSIMELPEGRDMRVIPFLGAGLAYGALLLTLH